jgi:dihydropteroate synthase
MHMRGTPQTMQDDLIYDDLIGDVTRSLKESVKSALAAGIPSENILVDPGIGFGKSFDQNYALLDNLQTFRDIAAGVLAGPSRKAFTGEFSKRLAHERLFPTAAAIAIAVLRGADAVRVHDVGEMKQVVDICDRFRYLSQP